MRKLRPVTVVFLPLSLCSLGVKANISQQLWTLRPRLSSTPGPGGSPLGLHPTSFLPLPSANGLCLWLFRSRNQWCQGPTHARVLTPERQLCCCKGVWPESLEPQNSLNVGLLGSVWCMPVGRGRALPWVWPPRRLWYCFVASGRPTTSGHSTSGPQFFHLEIEGGDWISSFQGPFQPCPLGPSKPSTAKEGVTELHSQGKPSLQFMGTVEELGELSRVLWLLNSLS